jgi:hypothetical protein
MGGLKEPVSGAGRNPYPRGFRTKLSSAGAIIGQAGTGSFLFRVLPWILRRNYSIFYQDLDRIVPFPPPVFPYTLRAASGDDIPAILTLRKGYYSKEILEKRLDDNQMAFAGWSGDMLIYLHWMFSGSFEIPYLGGRIELGPEEVYADEVYTRPGFREAGIYAHSSYLIRTVVRAKGFRRLFSAVASWNDGPRKNMHKAGMTEIAGVRRKSILKAGGRCWSGDIEVHDDGSFRFKAPR